jgi:hypothetical protein
MGITGLKRDPILKTGQKASIGTTGHNDKNRDNPILNGTYGHPILIYYNIHVQTF